MAHDQLIDKMVENLNYLKANNWSKEAFAHLKKLNKKSSSKDSSA